MPALIAPSTHRHLVERWLLFADPQSHRICFERPSQDAEAEENSSDSSASAVAAVEETFGSAINSAAPIPAAERSREL